MLLPATSGSIPALHRLHHRHGQRLLVGSSRIHREDNELLQSLQPSTFSPSPPDPLSTSSRKNNPLTFTERLPNANRLPNHRPGLPRRGNLPHPLAHRPNLRSPKLPHQTPLLPPHLHPLRRHLPPPPGHRRRHGLRRQSSG